MKAIWLVLTVALVAGLVFSQEAPKGTIEHIKVHGKSLEGNLSGETADRDVFIYLPPSYGKEQNRRYPAVYLLHGYGLTGERWVPFINLPAGADKAMAGGAAKEMILVSPDAYTMFGGSMYSNSVTSGDWEGYISHDLVEYVDSHYRTIANRMSRGLAGHSMGGYGTARIGMKHPEAFSSIYPMSACCLSARLDYSTPQTPPANNKKKADGKGKGGRGGGLVNAQLAEAAAWSPNPKNPPMFFDLPTIDGKPQPAIIAKWAANSPLAMLDQYVSNLKLLHAIQVDVGLQDGLLGSNKILDELLTQFDISHTFETYEGDHTSGVKQRFEQNVLPFFSKNLSFTAAKR
jgi:enterochelin esterase-like enzyme